MKRTAVTDLPDDPVQPSPGLRGPDGDDVSHSELAELRAQLCGPVPALPARYFYDGPGVALYDQIVDLPEYYPSRTELGILREHAADIIAAARPRHVVELGSGIGEKIGLLLDAMVAPGGPAEQGGRCTLFDIAEAWLPEAVAELGARYPQLAVDGVLGDFTTDLGRLGPGGERLVVFFAGTLGNFHPTAVPGFLRSVRATMDAGSDAMLVGVDLVKDPATIEAAYNDAAGVTAAFNRNMLAALNRRFDAGFETDAFVHRATFDPHPERCWIEMRLEATRPTRARLAGLELVFGPGDALRTELSTKYTRPRLAGMAGQSGLELDGWWTDPDERFALALLRPAAGESP